MKRERYKCPSCDERYLRHNGTCAYCSPFCLICRKLVGNPEDQTYCQHLSWTEFCEPYGAGSLKDLSKPVSSQPVEEIQRDLLRLAKAMGTKFTNDLIAALRKHDYTIEIENNTLANVGVWCYLNGTWYSDELTELAYKDESRKNKLFEFAFYWLFSLESHKTAVADRATINILIAA